MNKTSKALEALIEQFVAELKSELEVYLEERDSINFEIEVHRRWNWDTSSRQSKVVFKIYSDYDDRVEANSIMGAISEWLRRKGWNAANKPREIILLEAPREPKSELDDEIPF